MLHKFCFGFHLNRCSLNRLQLRREANQKSPQNFGHLHNVVDRLVKCLSELTCMNLLSATDDALYKLSIMGYLQHISSYCCSLNHNTVTGTHRGQYQSKAVCDSY